MQQTSKLNCSDILDAGPGATVGLLPAAKVLLHGLPPLAVRGGVGGFPAGGPGAVETLRCPRTA